MKHYFYIFTILFFFTVSAQNRKEQSIISSSRIVVIELESLNKLNLETLDKGQNVFKLSYENFDSTKHPLLQEKKGIIYITVKSKEIKLDGAQKNKYRAGQPNYPNYKISLPKDTQVKIIYDKGNFETTNFVGDLELYINHGIINMNDFLGSVFIQSFSGKISCYLIDSKINIENSKGILTSNLVDKNLIKTNNSIKGFYKSEANNLTIKTVRAKVDLKTIISQ